MISAHHNKNFTAISSHNRGFTLIELFIVIAIMGILAGAVLTVINPGKRSAQGRDAQRKNDISEIANTLVGYAGIEGNFPDPLPCDSSVGEYFATGCPPSPVNIKSNWWTNGSLSQALLTDQQFFKKIPVDPVNNSTYYYAYFTATDNSTPTACPAGIPPCDKYWIGARLEEPTDPTKPIFRCSNFPFLTDGKGCKEVGPDTLLNSHGINSTAGSQLGLPTN